MTAILARASSLAEVVRDGRAFVLNLARLEQQQVPRSFEGPAFEIWSGIDGTRTEDELVGELAESYGAPVARIAEDVRVLVEELRALGLVAPAQSG
ncbi:PqqD family protein [Demequina soli]|uniref:PqqD family protein n=1 Tax=Demequina soli TaxID=1638987 RepID=UPI000782D588|nr:PqqD family protein [Demequina soli]